mmetsp:Transcript_2964/g.7219  ORF Transcript_2964/g.7219 Transcript_2964/m.7219 type:complete len:444 (+) Transcript_2964:239-1570(+)
MQTRSMRAGRNVPSGAPAGPDSEETSSWFTGQKHPMIKDVDPAAEFLYKPRTVTVMSIGIALFFYFADVIGSHADKSLETSVKNGVAALAVTFLVYSSMYAPDTLMTRPHPVLWRIVHGISLLYMLLLVVILFMNADQARQALKYLSSSLGVEPVEKAYGDDCRIFTSDHPESKFAVIKDTIFDEFVVAHLLGWVCKAVVFRDWKMCFILSVAFEFMELTFKHILPNFNECWWDSWILDVLLCNNIGMAIGLMLVNRKGPKKNTTEAMGISSQPTFLLKVKRLFLQFTPRSTAKYQWRMLDSPQRFLQCIVIMICCLTCEVNAFFMKYVLWIPPTNPLNTYRLLIFFAMVIPAVNEFYFLICESGSAASKGQPKKLGVFTCIFLMCSALEVMIIFKFGKHLFDQPWPGLVKYSWIGLGTALVCILTLWSMRTAVAGMKKTRRD